MFDIKGFMSEIHTSGVLRTNRYHVTFAAPPSLRGDNVSIALDDPSSSTPLERMSLRCESVQVPGVTMATIDSGTPRLGYGPIESVPYSTIFDDITLTFLVDSKSEIHRFFYRWMNTIVNFHSRGQTQLRDAKGPVQGMKTYEVGYKKEYATNIDITVYDGIAGNTVTEAGSNRVLSQGNRVMQITAFNAYPKSLPSFEMSWGSTDEVVRLQIPFSYTDFEVIYPQEISPVRSVGAGSPRVLYPQQQQVKPT